LGAVVAIVAAMACASTGCTVIPVSGPYTVNDEAAGGDPLSKPFQRMIGTKPQPSWTPEQTLMGLQAAMAAYADDPTILPQYMTAEALAGWTASGPVTVLDDLLQPERDVQDGTDAVETIVLKGRQIATIDQDDTYIPQAGNWTRKFELVKAEGGGYRVRSLPDGLILTRSDVDRAYRPTKLYYVSGRTPNRLVVDNVRLRLKPAESYAKVVLERLLKSPSAALRGAATTGFPPGTKIDSVRSGEDERVVISLSGPIDPLDLSTEGAIMAQIRYSLNNNDVAKGRGILVLLDREEYSSYVPNSHHGWLDDTPNTAYYVSKGAVHTMSKDGPGAPVQGPAGQPREGYSEFAVSEDSALIAAKTSTGISVAGLTQEARWQEVIHGNQQDLTAPSWHPDGSLWTFDRKNGVVLRYDPASGRGPEQISAPGLKGFDVTRLRMARDGVRVVVTVGKDTVQIGALTSEGGLKLGNVRLLTRTDSKKGEAIQDMVWRDDEHLLVLVTSNAGPRLNEINIGDGEITEIPTKDKLQSVAALNERVLAEADAEKGEGSKIMELNPDQSWTTKIESGAAETLFPLG
jgi:hypothetical protein